MRDFPRDACSMASTLEVIGERWTMHVLRESFLGVRRFEDYRRNIGVARNILSDRLSTLVTEDILATRALQRAPAAVRVPAHAQGHRPPRDPHRAHEVGEPLEPEPGRSGDRAPAPRLRGDDRPRARVPRLREARARVGSRGAARAGDDEAARSGRGKLTRGEPAGWLAPSELRIGLGCMRLSTDEDRDDGRAFETIATAAEAGITVFDTARSYGRGAGELGHNERLLARALRECGADGVARVVTKGGMARVGDAWVPDGRAQTIRADCEASLEALDGLPIDLYLVHVPDPRTPWADVRARARPARRGRLVRRVGVANVNRAQLDEALELAPISAVQVRPEPVRRPSAPRRRRRALRRGGDRPGRALSARRASPCRRPRPARRSAEVARSRCDRGGGRARMAARARARRGPDPRRPPAGDGALCGARGDARARRGERAALERELEASGAPAARRRPPRATAKSSWSWASREPERAGSPRSTSPAATSA